jgi:lipoprotein signal peptidase
MALQMVREFFSRYDLIIFNHTKFYLLGNAAFLICLLTIGAIIIAIMTKGTKYQSITMVLFISAGMSNTWERIVYGGVSDYIKFPFFVSNIADLCLTLTFIFLILAIFGQYKNKHPLSLK